MTTSRRKTAHEPLPDAGTDRFGRIIASKAEGTERKQADEARAQLAAIVESSADAIISRAHDGKILTWNKGAERLFGYTAAEMIGANTLALIPPNLIAAAQHNRAFVQQGSVLSDHETVRVAKNGRRVDVSISASPIRDATGNITSVATVFHDITARKRAEETQVQLAAIVETSDDAIVSYHPDGTVLSWNAAAQKIFGYPAAEMIGRNISVLAPPERMHESQHSAWLLQHGKPVPSFESVRLTKDGRLVRVQVSTSAVRDAAGNVVRIAAILRDVTERKEAEAARARLAAIVENSNDAIFSRTLDGIITSWNVGAERMLGYTAAEAIGKPIAFTLPPGRPPNLTRNNEKVLRGEVVARESDRMTKDGRVIDVLTSHSPLKDKAGNIVGASVILQDISALKQAEAAMRESEERFRAAFEQAGVGMALRGIDSRNPRWLRVNEKLCDILGYTREELLQLTSVDITPPEDRQTAIDYNEKLLRGEITSYSREKRYVRKDGRIIWANLSLSAVRDASGRVQSAISVVEDISERKALERQFEDTFEQAAVGIAHVGLDERTMRVNRKFCDITGYAVGELVGKPISFLSFPADQRSGASGRKLLLEGKLSSHSNEKRYIRKDGSVIWVNRTESLARDDAGEALHFIRVIEGITERKRAEEARAQLAAVVENATVAIFTRTLDGIITSWNAGAEKMLGHTAAEAIGKHDAFTLPPGRAANLARNNESLLRGEVVARESDRMTKDGPVIDVLTSHSPIKDGAGNIVGASVILQDITARKRAEAERAQLAAIVESSQDAIVGRRLDGTITSWNSGAERIFGYTQAEALGRHITMLIPPERRDVFEANQMLLRDGRERPPFESIQLAKDGRRIPVSVSVSPIRDAQGRVMGVSIIVNDISERKHAEARQRLAATVFDNALDGIIITDENFKIVAVNRAFTDITGYSATEAMGNSPRLLRSYQHDEAFYEAMRRAVSETGSWQGEIWNKRKDGTHYCQLLAISAVHDERGEITNYCSILSDITERKVAEAKLVHLNAELEERVAARTRELERANRELEAFSYSVSHDLRAPLRHIIGFSAIVIQENEGKLDKDSIDNLGRIAAGAQRMAELIDDLLQLSRISRQEMRRLTFNLSELSTTVIKNLAQAYPERNVDVVIAPAMTVEGDPGLMHIALDNLLGNAWKFTSRTVGARIEIGREERDGELIYFVRDNGAGFDMKHSAKLFDAFQRLHSPKEFEGTGIGLSMVQRIVARHEGRIWADAEVGQGATFYFTLGKNGRPAGTGLTTG